MNQRNEEIVKYIEKKINEVNELYPNSLSDEKKQIAIDLFINRTDPLPILFKEIDTIAENTIKARQQQDVTQEPHQSNPDLTESGVPFSKIQTTVELIKETTKFASGKLYIAGGTVPYILLGQDSNRLHSDIDTVVDLKDINELREIFKNTPYYKEEWDSLNLVKDGNDYGFELDIDGVPVGIYPYLVDDDKIIQYTFDPYNTLCKIKKLPQKDINKYVNSYIGLNGQSYNTMSLEYIKKSKDSNPRPKDSADSEKIAQYGYSKEIYDSIDLPENMEVQKKSAEEINQNIDENDMIRNSIVRYAYIAKKKYGRDIPDEKLESAIRKFKGTSYEEIQQHLNQTLEGINNKRRIPIIEESKSKSLGYTTAMSLSLIFIIFGFIVCILAIELYLFYHI